MKLLNASASAKRIGKVEVDMGDTAFKVPLAVEAIRKVADRGAIGKKRKTARCWTKRFLPKFMAAGHRNAVRYDDSSEVRNAVHQSL